jgi:hypothetical protein
VSVVTRGEFDPKSATTWDERQQAVYETGHEEGQRCNQADWHFALSEEADIEDADPFTVAREITRLRSSLEAANRVVEAARRLHLRPRQGVELRAALDAYDAALDAAPREPEQPPLHQGEPEQPAAQPSQPGDGG